ncbi:MAG TPA: glycosyltransferase family 87 protein [Coleofasciculaceae cyanobacterium]|jgi:hypothetical protein
MSFYIIFYSLLLVTLAIDTVVYRFVKQRWLRWLGYGLPTLAIVLFLWTITVPIDFLGTLNDFNKAYYPAGRLILENPSKLYDPFDISVKGLGVIHVRDLGFVNIPIIALLFIPFSLLDVALSQILYTILGGIAIIIFGYLIVKLTKVTGWQRILLLRIILVNGPLYYSLKVVNSTHFVLFFLLAAIFCIQTKREIWLGILLAIAALIKIPLFLLGIYYFLRGRWQVVLGYGGALLGIVGASLLLFGVDLHLIWFERCIQAFRNKAIGAYNIQSVDGLLVRLLTDGNIGNWDPIELGLDFKVIRYVLLSLLIGGTIWICWRSKPPITIEEQNLEFSIVLCLALVISPISWTHYYLFLLVPLSLYLGEKLAIPQGWLWFSSVVLSILLISPAVRAFTPANPILRFLMFKLLFSHYFFGGILLLGILLTARLQTSKVDTYAVNISENIN